MKLFECAERTLTMFQIKANYLYIYENYVPQSAKQFL